MKPEALERLKKWVIELGEHNISYEYCTVIKAQDIADFLTEFTPGISGRIEVEPPNPQTWNLYMDGSSNREGCGPGLLLESLAG